MHVNIIFAEHHFRRSTLFSIMLITLELLQKSIYFDHNLHTYIYFFKLAGKMTKKYKYKSHLEMNHCASGYQESVLDHSPTTYCIYTRAIYI